MTINNNKNLNTCVDVILAGCAAAEAAPANNESITLAVEAFAFNGLLVALFFSLILTGRRVYAGFFIN